MKTFLNSIAYYFINYIINRIPSRLIRIYFYHHVSGKKISKKASIGLHVRFLDIRKVEIGDRSNINFGSTIDGRGEGIKISHDVDVAPQVNIWSLEHDPDSVNHESRSGKVIIGHHVWIANRAIILPNTIIESGAVIGAGGVVKGLIKKNTLNAGNPARVIKSRSLDPVFKLRKIRRFR